MKKLFSILSTLSLLGLASAHGQVLIDNLNDPYSQNFNSLPTGSDTSFTWAQGDAGTPTLDDWYYSRGVDTFAGSTNGRALESGLGSNRINTDRILSLASAPGAANSERSIGLRSTGTVGNEGGYFGIQLRNNTGSQITTLDVSFTGQEWLQTETAGNLDFYHFDANGTTSYTSFSTGGGTGMDVTNNGTKVNALSFSGTAADGFTVIDGNLPANSSFYSNQITGLTWANGDDLWLVWNKVDDNSALAIDDFTVTAIPEPSSLALLAGALGLGLVMLRRRR